MIINISSGSSGWGEYVMNGTIDKPRDKSKVEFLDGDIDFGDLLCKVSKYEESYYKIVLGFQGKPNDNIVKGAYLDFKENFLKGFNKDEYHIDAVIHKDTDDTHIHVRIPKQNLLTGTHLQLYYDKIDRPRKELIQDFISLKYGFEIARETNRAIIKETSHEHIQKWRDERGQESFNFSLKKHKNEAEKSLNQYIRNLISAGTINSQNEIKTTLETLDLKVIKFDRDLKKDFAYVTIENSTGKMRIKGEIYDENFFNSSVYNREATLETNKRTSHNTKPQSQRFEQVQKELAKANEKRFTTVTKLFRAARKKAVAKLETTIDIGKKETENQVRDQEQTICMSNMRVYDTGSNDKKKQKKKRDTLQFNLGEMYEHDFTRIRRSTKKRVEAFRATREARVKFLERAQETANTLRAKCEDDSRELSSKYGKIANATRVLIERVREVANAIRLLFEAIAHKTFISKMQKEKEESHNKNHTDVQEIEYNEVEHAQRMKRIYKIAEEKKAQEQKMREQKVENEHEDLKMQTDIQPSQTTKTRRQR